MQRSYYPSITLAERLYTNIKNKFCFLITTFFSENWRIFQCIHNGLLHKKRMEMSGVKTSNKHARRPTAKRNQICHWMTNFARPQETAVCRSKCMCFCLLLLFAFHFFVCCTLYVDFEKPDVRYVSLLRFFSYTLSRFTLGLNITPWCVLCAFEYFWIFPAISFLSLSFCWTKIASLWAMRWNVHYSIHPLPCKS